MYALMTWRSLTVGEEMRREYGGELMGDRNFSSRSTREFASAALRSSRRVLRTKSESTFSILMSSNHSLDPAALGRKDIVRAPDQERVVTASASSNTRLETGSNRTRRLRKVTPRRPLAVSRRSSPLTKADTSIARLTAPGVILTSSPRAVSGRSRPRKITAGVSRRATVPG